MASILPVTAIPLIDANSGHCESDKLRGPKSMAFQLEGASKNKSGGENAVVNLGNAKLWF